MRVLILAQNFPPEGVGPGINYHQLGTDLIAKGHQVTMLTAFPHYPDGFIFDGYQGRAFQREVVDGIEVIRTWIYATPSKNFWPRALNFGSFSASSLLGGLIATRKFDIIYAVLPPLTLGMTAVIQAVARRTPVVVSIQDIYPYAAVVMGFLRNRTAIRFFERMEKWIYRRANHIVVISEGFRDNLKNKGVPPEKISVVSNWADPEFIQPGPKNNSFRRELGVDGSFTLIYSGSISHNSNLEPVLHAADLLRDKSVSFVIVGDGVHKPALEQLAAERRLENIQFKLFQPLSRYAEVLRAADMTLVTLSNQAALASVPSKIFKQMASGRPILAITAPGNEVDRLIEAAQCGICVPPDDPVSLADALLWAQAHPEELNRMGQNGRLYFEEHHSRSKCVTQIESILQQVLSQ
jgi:colanic acid biosynthesis glycosyl transferase WcaI